MSQKAEPEINMGWNCACTNKHACNYHKEVSFYRGTDDFGTLPINSTCFNFQFPFPRMTKGDIDESKI